MFQTRKKQKKAAINIPQPSKIEEDLLEKLNSFVKDSFQMSNGFSNCVITQDDKKATRATASCVKCQTQIAIPVLKTSSGAPRFKFGTIKRHVTACHKKKETDSKKSSNTSTSVITNYFTKPSEPTTSTAVDKVNQDNHAQKTVPTVEIDDDEILGEAVDGEIVEQLSPSVLKELQDNNLITVVQLDENELENEL